MLQLLIPLFIYLSFFLNLNYLVGIIILLLIYIIFIFTTSTNDIKQLIPDKPFLNEMNNNSSKPITMIYKTKYKSIYDILVKIDFLKNVNNIEYSNAIKNLNTFLYLLNKSNKNNTTIYTLLKDNRDQLLNKLKASIITIPTENTKLIKFLEKNITKLLELTQYYLQKYCNRKTKYIDVNYPVYHNINDPQPNPIDSIDYSTNYSFY